MLRGIWKSKRARRLFAGVLAVVLAVTNSVLWSLAEEDAGGSASVGCAHERGVHDETCGYKEEIVCTHEHDDATCYDASGNDVCGHQHEDSEYIEVSPCTHQHNEECGGLVNEDGQDAAAATPGITEHEHTYKNGDNLCDVCGEPMSEEQEKQEEPSGNLDAFLEAMNRLMALAGNEGIDGDEYAGQMLAGVQAARELYEKLSATEKKLQDVVDRKGALDSFAGVMPLWGLSGDCGSTAKDNVQWEMVSLGNGKYKLVISGKGEMADYTHVTGGGDDKTSAPWADDPRQIGNITEVEIQSGVTRIGKYAFYGGNSSYATNGITKVTIADSVTKIGHGAFQNCSGISSLDLSKVKYIYDDAFNGCSNLKGVSLDNGVSWSLNLANICAVDKGAFQDCTSLSNVAFGNNWNEIGEGAFSGCKNLENIYIPDTEVAKLESWERNRSTIAIRKEAFKGCIKLKSVKIPNSVEEMGSKDSYGNLVSYVFSGCTALENVKIPGSRKSSSSADRVIGAGMFSECTSLKTVEFYDNNNVTEINANAFYKCTSLSTFDLSKIRSIGKSAFSECSSLSTLDLSSIVEIGEGAFSGCTSLKGSLNVNGSNGPLDVSKATKIGNAAFSGCTSLSGVTLGGELSAISEKMFFECESLKGITIPEGVISIGAYAFEGSGLKKIVVPDTVTEWGYNGCYFRNCTSLTEVTLPKNIEKMNQSFFAGCSSLKEFDFSRYKNLKEIMGSVFHGTQLTFADLSKTSVKTIYDHAFAECSTLEKVILSPTLGTGAVIQSQVFPNSLKELVFTSNTVPTFRNLGNNSLIIANWSQGEKLNKDLKILVPVESEAAYKEFFKGFIVTVKENGVDKQVKDETVDRIVTAGNAVHTWKWTTITADKHVGECTVSACTNAADAKVDGSHADFKSALPTGITSPPNMVALNWSESVKGDYEYCGVCGYAQPKGAGGTADGKPKLKPVSTARTDANAGTVTFQSDTAGTYYYKLVKRGEGAPLAISGYTEGDSCGQNADKVISFADLKGTVKDQNYTGEYDVWIVVKNSAGTESEPLKIPVPPYVNFGKQTVNNGKSREITLPSGFTLVSNTPPTVAGTHSGEYRATIDGNGKLVVTFTPVTAVLGLDATVTVEVKNGDGKTISMTIPVTGEGVNTPTIRPVSSERENEQKGSVTFTSTHEGKYYYVVKDADDTAQAPDAVAIINENKTGDCNKTTTGNTINFTDLAGTGAKKVYIVMKEGTGGTGAESNVIEMIIPPCVNFGEKTVNSNTSQEVTLPSGFTPVSGATLTVTGGGNSYTAEVKDGKLVVTFKPGSEGKKDATVTVTVKKDGGDDTITIAVPVTGTGKNPPAPPATPDQPRHEHSYTQTKAPTCTTAGEERCSCGDTKTIPSLGGHSWDAGTVTKAPECETAGTKTVTCTRCGEKQEETIPAIGHDWDGGTVTKAATVDEEGVRTYTCRNDASHKKTGAIPKLRAETPLPVNPVTPNPGQGPGQNNLGPNNPGPNNPGPNNPGPNNPAPNNPGPNTPAPAQNPGEPPTAQNNPGGTPETPQNPGGSPETPQTPELTTTVQTRQTPPIDPNAKPIPDPGYGIPTYWNVTPDPNDPNSPDIIVVIDDDGVPLAYRKIGDPDNDDNMIYMEDPAIPLAGPARLGAWALVNLILTAVSVLAGIVALVRYIKKRKKDEEEDGKEAKMEDEKDEEEKKKYRWHILSILAAAVSVIVFFLTENMRLPMQLVDKWTILMAVLALLTVPGLLQKRREEERDEENAQRA